ncbi:MAG: electron transfer flavoprotein subunit alpha/FixB family protein, partial [Chloroflexi bacterium]|nr:electron transfer flavoprotein subunit alpha/FixB family protein [Chloroflexota bacterium]
MEQCNVWLFAEAKITDLPLKLASEAKKLANGSGGEVCAVFIGEMAADAVQDLGAHGVTRVFAVDDPLLKEYSTEAYTQILAELTNEYKPTVVLFGTTSRGNDLAPRLAARLGAGFIANCIELNLDKEVGLVARKPIYGGNAHATVTALASPLIATIDPKVLEVKKAGVAGIPEIIRPEVKLRLDLSRTRVVEQIKADPITVDVSEASVVVSVGRGLGQSEQLKTIEELAGVLGGSIGGSRIAVDEGWIPHERLVGSSGKNASAELYLALGISGADHHTSGIRGSKLIIAVNN